VKLLLDLTALKYEIPLGVEVKLLAFFNVGMIWR
jgi:hypothetical protein